MLNNSLCNQYFCVYTLIDLQSNKTIVSEPPEPSAVQVRNLQTCSINEAGIVEILLKCFKDGTKYLCNSIQL